MLAGMTKFAKSNKDNSIDKIVICIYDSKGYDKFKDAWEGQVEEAKESDSSSDASPPKKQGKSLLSQVPSPIYGSNSHSYSEAKG